MSDAERTAGLPAGGHRSTPEGVPPPARGDRPRRRSIGFPISGTFRRPAAAARCAGEPDDAARERRRHGRQRFEQQLLFRVQKGVPAAVARTRNLSRGGLCIESTRPIRRGEIISGAFRVDPGAAQPPIEFVGEVVWHWSSRHARLGFALRFLYLSDEDRRRVERLTGAGRAA